MILKMPAEGLTTGHTPNAHRSGVGGGSSEGRKSMYSEKATISIRNLRLRTYIGFNPDEKAKRQDVVINAQIQFRPHPDALRDKVSSALDYKVIPKQIIDHVENGRFLLLEKLAQDLVEICRKDPSINRVVVAVDKPHALRFADSVSVTLEHESNAN